jgi:hypothetical protein
MVCPAFQSLSITISLKSLTTLQIFPGRLFLMGLRLLSEPFLPGGIAYLIIQTKASQTALLLG